MFGKREMPLDNKIEFNYYLLFKNIALHEIYETTAETKYIFKLL